MSTFPVARPARSVSASRIGIALNAGLALAALLLWAGMARRGDFERADFTAFYTGWSLVLHGHGDHLYDFAWQADSQGRLVPERAEAGTLLPYVYTPHFIFGAPLALLPLPVAFYVWTALQAALLAIVVSWLWRDTVSFGPEAPTVAITALFAFQPLFLTFQLGQQALMSLVAIYGLARSLRADRQFAAGAWLALASLKPQLAILPVLFLLGERRWRVLLWAIGIFAVWAGAATVVLGWRCWPEFLSLTAFHARQFNTYGVFPLRGHNFKMVFAALLGGERLPWINGLTSVVLVAAGVAGFTLGRKANGADGRRSDLCLAITLLLGELAAPHLNPHDDLLLVVPAVLLYDVQKRNGQPTRFLATLYILCPLIFLADSFGMDRWPSRIRPFFFIIVGLTLVAAREWALAHSELSREAKQPKSGNTK